MLKSALKNVLRRFRPALKSPTLDEQARITQLRESFRDIPEQSTRDALPSEAAWIRYMNLIRQEVLRKDPRDFLNWPVIEETMCPSFALYIRKELAYLRGLSDWPRWRRAIQRNGVGNPIPYLLYPW